MTAAPGWLGRLSLQLEVGERGTRLVRSSHEGPLRVQRVLEPEGPACPHIYLLHPPGGVVGGDRLQTRVDLGPGAHVLLTTPAAQKLYRSAGQRAEIENVLCLAAGAKLDWLPSETLAFPAALAHATTRVELGARAAFIGWDIACYGMPARREAFDTGRVVSRFELYREGTPLAIEALELGESRQLLDAAFALRGQPVVGNLYAVPPDSRIDDALVARLRDAVERSGDEPVGVSSLGELLVVRALGSGVERVRTQLIEAWRLLRPELLSRPAQLPRVWAT